MRKYVLVALLFFFGFSYADEPTGYRKITGMGCHVVDGICFVNLEGSLFGSTEGCSSVQARWDSSTAGGKNNLSMLMAAWLAGKEVDLYLRGCQDEFWPTFAWANYR